MTNRRQFLAGSIAATVIGSLGASGSGVGRERGGGGSVSLARVLYDQRYSESRDFGDEMRGFGLEVRPFHGDITDVWFTELEPLWRGGAATVAGLTTESALFCLERLAWDHRLRVTFRAEHALQPDRCVEHTVSCARAALDRVHDLERINTGWWAPEMAHLVADMPAGVPADAQHKLLTPAATAGGDSSFLVSWIIGPGSRIAS